MCFSAEASFTVGTVLAVIGATTLKKGSKGPLKLMALIPILFAIQQYAEGIVWINMVNGSFIKSDLSQIARVIFLLFAWVIWPLYIPIAFVLPETETWKKLTCLACFAIGVFIAYVDMGSILNEALTTEIKGNSLHYGGTPTHGNLLYGIAVMVPIFISRIKDMWKFGLWLLATFTAAQLIYQYTFTSVWCFFAAAVSLMLLKVLSEENKRLTKAARV